MLAELCRACHRRLSYLVGRVAVHLVEADQWHDKEMWGVLDDELVLTAPTAYYCPYCDCRVAVHDDHAIGILKGTRAPGGP